MTVSTAVSTKVVVDTYVVAYYLLGTEPYRDECAAFFRREGCRLVTFDERLLELFPAVACSPRAWATA